MTYLDPEKIRDITVDEYVFPSESLKVEDLEIIQSDGNNLKLRYKDIHYTAIVLENNIEQGTMKLRIEGNTHRIKINTNLSRLIEELGFHNSVKTLDKDLAAPMPGLVLNIAVEPGQSVSEGDALLTLEAMKMENIIKAPGAGVVASIPIEVGAKVDKGNTLIIFE